MSLYIVVGALQEVEIVEEAIVTTVTALAARDITGKMRLQKEGRKVRVRKEAKKTRFKDLK